MLEFQHEVEHRCAFSYKTIIGDDTRLIDPIINCSIGGNIKLLIDRPDGKYCFREHKDRVYYMSQMLLHLASTAKQDQLISCGTCFGKFTKSGKFRLNVTALDYLAPYAQVSNTIFA
jgi:60S ribosome subunit biogenesis protein NIP7